MLICTVSGANHIPKVVCLRKSLLETQPPHEFVSCLVERDLSAMTGFWDSLPRVVLASELGIPEFDFFMFQHESQYDACCAVKAQLLLWAMREFPQENDFIFLDPDMRAYSSFEEVHSLLRESNVILTPHHLSRDGCFDIVWTEVCRTLATGIFNAGFLALQRSRATEEFLNWWNHKLQVLCLKDASKGLYFDQRWLDMAMTYFDIRVLNEPGYNVAHWNIYERRPVVSPETGSVLVGGKPLRCFHFSMVDSGQDVFYFSRYLEEDNPLFKMRTEYLRDTSAADVTQVYRLDWSYDRYISGEQIGSMVRALFRFRRKELAHGFPDPFRSSNAEILAEMGRRNRPGSVKWLPR